MTASGLRACTPNHSSFSGPLSLKIKGYWSVFTPTCPSHPNRGMPRVARTVAPSSDGCPPDNLGGS